jgi:5'-deoxynucleotidase YfbR-like HD superfamily hydrolase
MTHTVNRWHCHPEPRLRNSGDTTMEHQARVAGLCARFAVIVGMDADRAHELQFAAWHHDEAEKIVGDIPGPAKDRFPALAAAYAKAELEVLNDMKLNWNLTRQESDLLHLADKLDGELWARKHGVMGAHDCDKLQAMADRLGVGDAVRGVLE